MEQEVTRLHITKVPAAAARAEGDWTKQVSFVFPAHKDGTSPKLGMRSSNTDKCIERLNQLWRECLEIKIGVGPRYLRVEKLPKHHDLSELTTGYIYFYYVATAYAGDAVMVIPPGSFVIVNTTGEGIFHWIFLFQYKDGIFQMETLDEAITQLTFDGKEGPFFHMETLEHVSKLRKTVQLNFATPNEVKSAVFSKAVDPLINGSDLIASSRDYEELINGTQELAFIKEKK